MRGILQSRRPALVALAERLIEKEVIDTLELKQIIEANSPSAMIVPGTADSAARRAGGRTPRRRQDGRRREVGCVKGTTIHCAFHTPYDCRPAAVLL